MSKRLQYQVSVSEHVSIDCGDLAALVIPTRDLKVGDTLLLYSSDEHPIIEVLITYITNFDSPCALSSEGLDERHSIVAFKVLENELHCTDA